MSNKEKLVVEVIGAHNLMPKDGAGSSSPFVEVEFESQRLRTHVKPKNLNPIWNHKLVFPVTDLTHLPYRTLEVNVFNLRRSSSSRNFLGKVRISGSDIAKGGGVPKMYTLDKRSLFSNVRGEISLKLYVSTKEKETCGDLCVKKSKKVQESGSLVRVQEKNELTQKENQVGEQNGVANPGGLVPVVRGGAGGGGVVGVGVSSNGSSEFELKETKPHLGGGPLKDKTSSTYDLVEQMQYLYVRVIKARDFTLFGNGEVLAEVKLGNYKGITKRVSSSIAEWDQVFAFSKECIQSSIVEVFVKERDKIDFFGRVLFDLNEVPKRVPPDSQLAPQWHRMEDKRGDRSKAGEIMISIWFGTQADEAFAEAWHSKAANVHFDGLSSIKSKVYLSPKLWYLRVTIMEAHIVLGEKNSSILRYPEFFAKVHVGNQVLRTRISPFSTNRALSSPYWNEDLIFVVAEPFEDYVLVSVEDRVGPGREEVVGRILLPVATIERRWDDKSVPSRWFNLDNHQQPYFSTNLDSSKGLAQSGLRIHIRASLDGEYHVLDEATLYSSDLRPTAKQLQKPHIGVLEMGILGAKGLMPMKIKEGKGGTTDAYCVAKYGQKWVRTRTVVDSLSPKWNEQYTWEVFDPCTVITIAVFDNSRIDKNIANAMGARDSRIGKVRIHLSMVETGRVYTHSYPLLVLHTSGVKKMGELHLAVRFSCANMGNMLHMYTLPLLPNVHYSRPLSVHQVEGLRYRAVNVVVARLSRAEPPLGREVVEYMLDHDTHMWSMRKSRANFCRLMDVISTVIFVVKYVEAIRNWHKPIYSTLFVLLFLFFVAHPELIIPTMLLYMALVGIWRYRTRPRDPPHMDTSILYLDTVYPDELDEDFDLFPSTRNIETIRMRYDRLRSVAGRVQTVVGDLATQGERVQALLSWRDPRATFLAVVMCLVATVGFYLVPSRVVVALWGLYVVRPPRFRTRLPPQGFSFFKRLPSVADSLL